jgi:transcriptional regulator with XRE-family HTH domain
MDQVGREVRRLREERGWSQARLAVAADMSVSGVSLIENGRRNLSTATLEKLARALDVEVRDLFPLVETPLFQEQPKEDREERRREVMAQAFEQTINEWERLVDERASPTLSRSIASSCQLANDAITSAVDLVGRWGSGQLTEQEFARIKGEYEAERAEWWAIEDRLYEIARRAIEHFESSEAAKEAEVFELQKHQEKLRLEIRRRTKELSA